MRTKLLLCCAAALGGLLIPNSLRADDSSTKPATPSAKPADSAKSAPAPTVRFRPGSAGAPSVRVTGGSRGKGDSTITLDVLAPDETGLTTQEEPSLLWYQSKPAPAKFELTLLEENKPKPLLQVKANGNGQAGIQRIKLSDHNVKINPGVEYQWVVALVTDPDNRSSDLVASGVIKRVEASVDLKGKVAAANRASLPGVYAEAGIWYDALSVLTDEIEADPGNKSLRDTRADLLRQVGLKAAAEADGSLAKK
jgi:hypothetical protein